MASISNYGALEIYNHGQRVIESSTALFPHHTRCDFCDVTFTCDLDCSRHLTSPAHIRNKDEFMSIQNLQDEVVEKSTPKSLGQVFDCIKVRAPRDLTELADKGYFDIIDETGFEIAEEMANILFKSIVKFQSNDLPPESKAVLMSAMEAYKQQANMTRPTVETIRRQDQAPSNSTQPISECKASTSQPARTSSRSDSSSQPRPAPSSDKHIQSKIAKISVPSNSSTKQSPVSQQPPAAKKVPTAKRSMPLPPLRTPVRDEPSTATPERNKRPTISSPGPETQTTQPKTTRTQPVENRSKSSAPPTEIAKAPVKRSQPAITNTSAARPRQPPSSKLPSPPVRQVPAPVWQSSAQQLHNSIQRLPVRPPIRVNLPVAQLQSPNIAIRSQSIATRQLLAQNMQAPIQANPTAPREVGHTVIRYPALVPDPNNQYTPVLSTIKTEPRDN